MIFYEEVHGFESEDLNAVAQEVGLALGTEPLDKHNDGYGGDYAVFRPAEGGELKLYDNQSRMDEEWQEKEYKEFGLILLIEQQDEYADYAAKLEGMKTFKPTLLYRVELNNDPWVYRKLYELKPGSLKEDLSKPPPNWQARSQA